ncbi:MAG: nitroreductase family protein [Spirochaetia bacterium]
MDFLKLSQMRRSCRAYSAKPVERGKIERCLEAARLAPSACNAQPWYFVVVDDPALKEAVAKATFSPIVGFNKFTLQAPVMIVITSEPQKLIPFVGSQLKGIPYRLLDIGITAEHFCLQAAEAGLGTCMIGWFNERKIKAALKLSRSRKVELLISLGYAADKNSTRSTTHRKHRKKLQQMRRYNI